MTMLEIIHYSYKFFLSFNLLFRIEHKNKYCYKGNIFNKSKFQKVMAIKKNIHAKVQVGKKPSPTSKLGDHAIHLMKNRYSLISEV